MALRSSLLACACACVLASAPTPAPAPRLLPGESLALAGSDGRIFSYGPADREAPLGVVAKAVWLKLEWAEWGSEGVAFKCPGTLEGLACTRPKGHGRVDVGRALREDCDLAFLAWARFSAARWAQDYGPGPARARLLDAFGPFLGRRLPPGEDVPALDLAWVGRGDLLRASPESLLAWLLDPAQDQALRALRREILPFLTATLKDDAWWILAGGAPSLEPGAGGAWVLGGNGTAMGVLHLSRPAPAAEAAARFRALLNVPG